MDTRSLIVFLLGIVVFALGIWLLCYFWADFVNIIKGILGLIVIFIGIGIAFAGFITMKAKAYIVQYRSNEDKEMKE